MVGPALQRSVTRLPTSVRKVADHHFAWSSAPGRQTADAGKALRPALAFLFAQAVGGHARDALRVAVAVELVHNFSLIHDDVMDGDELRRHRPTAWSAFGVPQAILTGDALLTLALQILAEDARLSAATMGQLSTALLELVEGQSADIAFESRSRVDLAECTAMAARKTGALIGAACILGALAGGADTEQAKSAQQYGLHLGVAFQLVDDILGVWGDPAVTGKPVFADLMARKKTLPVVAALTSGTPEAVALADIYAQPRPAAQSDLCRAAELIERAGGRQWCEAESLRRLRAAECHLESLDLAAGPKADICTLAAMLVERDH
jgi:geranylgeranyl diphosphate synthase type I